jgi:predicted PurR-regulated permease PerM
MSRVISFVVLILATSLLLALFYQVVSVFLLPLFLAAVTVLLLRPLHLLVVGWCNSRRYVAALLMTAGVLLAVLVPVLTVATIAGQEALDLFHRFDSDTMRSQLDRARTTLGLDYPFVAQCRFIDSSLEQLRTDAANGAMARGDSQAIVNITDEFRRMNENPVLNSRTDLQPGVERLHEALSKAASSSPGTLAYQQRIETAVHSFREYRNQMLGGVWLVPLKEMANPTSSEIQRISGQVLAITPGGIASLSGATSVAFAKVAFGLLIFVMALFFWFADGPEIVSALMVLSPLEDKYEQQLLTEFQTLVRAVVAGSIASATAQAVLSGIGFWFAGMQSIFLLMALTALLAMVPFVGASLVWIPASLWLAFGEGNMTAGIALAIYGTLIVSTVDNVIRPWIIMEQASLHPLAGLLGVLGGIQTLGPLGVFIGPIVVAFLQTLLTLLHREFSGDNDEAAAKPD